MKQDFSRLKELTELGVEHLDRYLCPVFDITHLYPYQIWKDERDQRDQGRFWGHLPPTDQIKSFLDDVGDIVDPETVLEIGIGLGYNATYMLQSWPTCKILGVDQIAFQKYPEVNTDRAGIELVMEKYPGRYFPLQCDSKEIGKGWLNPNAFFDLAFVNSYADIQSCKDLNIKYFMIDNTPEDHNKLIEITSVEYETVRSLVNGHPPQRLQMRTEKIGLYTWKK